MLQNYIKIALRNLFKNRLYAAINIIGLAIGLTFYLFGGILVDYENNHDTMFKNHARTYTVASLLNPNAGIGLSELTNTYTAMGPLIEANMPDAEAVARTVRKEFLISNQDSHYSEPVWFADKTLLDIFDFTYLSGDKTALDSADGVVLDAQMAEKIFGRTDVVGKTIKLDHTHTLTVKAVIANLPRNSHFVSSLFSKKFSIIAPVEARNRIDGWALEGNWNNLSTGNNIYVMTRAPMDSKDVTEQINTIFQASAAPELQEQFMTGLKAHPLKETHSAFWDAVGLPVLTAVQILGLFILVIAIVNYTNLSTAQGMGRTREVGLRKTLGGTRFQLLTQFLVESLTLTALSLLLSLAFLELLIPYFNSTTNKVMSLDYGALLPWLLSVTLTVGIAAGAYPSYLITRTNPIMALSGEAVKGGLGNLFRSGMLTVQFVISIFILSAVMIVFFQNERVKESSSIFPKDEVLVFVNTDKEDIRKKEQALKDQLKRLPNVESVSFATQVPFEQSNSQMDVTPTKGDENSRFTVNLLTTDHDFLKTFDIPIIAGRDFSTEIANDTRTSADTRRNNVIINEMAARQLGYHSLQEAVGKIFYDYTGDPSPGAPPAFEFTIIGVMPDLNIHGLHNEIKPWIFDINQFEGQLHRFGAVRIKKGAPASTITDVENIWKQVIPNYPAEHRFLNDLFNDVYKIMAIINKVLAGFAFVALALGLVGLFGLAAFMARSNTKEIGIRKVMGATVAQLMRLLLLKFSKPVLWSVLFALPLTYFAAGKYLEFFSENRFDMQLAVILFAGLITLLVAWGVIAFHAYQTAKTKPIHALRYE